MKFPVISDVWKQCLPEINIIQIWVRDIPINVSDKKLAQTFGKFGEIEGIIVDRYQSVRQHKWIKYKQNELKQDQKNELNKTIETLRNTVDRNVINDYQVKLCRN